VLRQVVAATLLVLVLAVAAEACGPAAAEVTPDSPAAQATNTRRTAVAEVQGIIANHPTATPSAAATAVPSPTCQNAIWWSDVRSHIGETRMIQGTIIGSRPAPGGLVLLEIGQPYPDPTGLAVLVPDGPAANLSGKSICVTGKISVVQGRPTIQLRDPAAIRVVD